VLAAVAIASVLALPACGGKSSATAIATPIASPTVAPLKIVTPTPVGAAPIAATAAAASASSAPAASAPGSYVVQSGDTLYSIAARFSAGLDALMKANGISDPSALSAGQTLVIPARTP
jgi:LysM repeat protein